MIDLSLLEMWEMGCIDEDVVVAHMQDVVNDGSIWRVVGHWSPFLASSLLRHKDIKHPDPKYNPTKYSYCIKQPDIHHYIH